MGLERTCLNDRRGQVTGEVEMQTARVEEKMHPEKKRGSEELIRGGNHKGFKYSVLPN